MVLNSINGLSSHLSQGHSSTVRSSQYGVNPSAAYGNKTPTNGQRKTPLNDKENQPSINASTALSNAASIVNSREDLNKTYSVLEGRRNTNSAV